MIQIMRRGTVVPSRLSLARREAGLTQEESAEQAGLTRVTIARYETGHRAPSELALNMLATIYDKPYEWFFRQAEPAAPPLLPSRLHRARRESGLTQEEAAERTGVARNTVSRYELGRQAPSGRALLRLAAIYGKPMEWFFGEEDEPQGDSGRVNAPESGTQPTPESSDVIVSLGERLQDFSARFDRLETYIRAQAPVQAIGESRPGYGPSNYDKADRSPVRLLEVASAAGVGAEVYDETPIGLLWFRNDWLQSHSIDPEQSNIISVRGASMEPTLPDGCSILVDRKRREPHEDRIYVMRTEEGLVVKRVNQNAQGWWLMSDNPAWAPLFLSEETDIIGEVRWSARTY